MAEGRVSIKEAAERMEVCEQFVRIGLQRERLPFGVAIKMSTRWTYHISPAKFEEYLLGNPIGTSS